MTLPSIGVPEQHHGVSHHRNDPQLIAKKARIDVYQSQLFAYFLEKLQSMPEGDGSVLDQSLLLYGGGMSGRQQRQDSRTAFSVVAHPLTPAELWSDVLQDALDDVRVVLHAQLVRNRQEQRVRRGDGLILGELLD